ncbi:dUTP diphosphatase [Bacillus massilinigeriensis]|uniref:dUTP diphosphatase n=1 Tax=Bacillus mediterraneensis TaxID=1805474 RepID=UPI0008F83B57|nr:dUTP diphosphatase [Bacillus mediterraneensis]
MNYEKLFGMQRELDHHIEQKHALKEEDLFERKILALLVELGELANETRCFKFWSLKPSSEKAVILEEFVDGIHFMLSLGIELGYDGKIRNAAKRKEKADISVTAMFIRLYESILSFNNEKTEDTYWGMLDEYLELAEALGFTEEEMEKAYFEKNEVNYERQRKGY